MTNAPTDHMPSVFDKTMNARNVIGLLEMSPRKLPVSKSGAMGAGADLRARPTFPEMKTGPLLYPDAAPKQEDGQSVLDTPVLLLALALALSMNAAFWLGAYVWRVL